MKSSKVTFLLICAVLLSIQACQTTGRRALNEDLGPPPGTYKILSTDGEVRIPFEIFRDDIRMMTEIDGKPFRMLLDNGSLWDQLLFFGSERVDALDLDYRDQIQVGGSGEGEPVMADVAEDIRIRFPGIEFIGQTAIVTDADSGLTELWEGCEGQVSAAFFKHFVVEIDFDGLVILLHDPETYEYRGHGSEIIMTPAPHSSYTIPAEVRMEDGTARNLSLMLDLGGVNPVELTIGARSGIQLPKKAIKGVLGAGTQGEYRGHYGRIPSLQIGDYTVEDVLTGFVEERNSAECQEDEEATYDDHIIGFPLLSYFNLVFDYHRERMFIEPNSRFNEPSEYNMTGMSLRPDSEGSLKVVRVLPESPASEAGIVEGDTIVQVNGRDADEYRLWELNPLFRDAGAEVLLTVEREDKEWKVPLTLRRLI